MDDIPAAEFDSRFFDAKEVVQRYRKRVPLPQLQKSLRGHHAATRQELVELINEKYADFVSLSSRMQGVERALRPLRAPLEESSELARSLQAKLGGIVEQARDTQKDLAAVREKKEALVVYIENAKIFAAAKEAATQRWGNPQESDDYLREYVAQENVARDLRHIRLNIGRQNAAPQQADTCAQVSPECRALLKEVAEFEELFAGRLRERLRGLLAAQSWEDAEPPRTDLLAIAHLSRALTTIGRAAAVESTFAEVFVTKALESATRACAEAAEEARRQSLASGEPGGSRAGQSFSIGAGAVDLSPFFDSVRAALLGDASPLLWFARRLRSSDAADGAGEMEEESALLVVSSLRLVSNAIAVPVLRHVQETWPNVFMPAFPDIFAANYAQAAGFISSAEGLMSAPEWRSFSRLAADFRRRWKTQVYHSLRQKEATQRLEAPQDPEGDFSLGATAEVMRLLETMWGRWYLEALFPKTAQLTLELLSRYGQLVSRLSEAKDPLGAGWQGDALAWSGSSPPVKLARTAADVLAIISALQAPSGDGPTGGIARLLEGRLQQISAASEVDGANCGRIVRALLDEAIVGLRPVLARLEQAISGQVMAVVAPQFGAIRGIPALYRMLNKPVPTKPSPYVESAMRPVFALCDATRAVAPSDAVAGWARSVADAAASEFSVQASQLLESTRQQEASLRRLAGRGGAGEAQATDLDKIHVQICLDADAFIAAVGKLGAVVEGDSGCARLAKAVEPARSAFSALRPAAGDGS